MAKISAYDKCHNALKEFFKKNPEEGSSIFYIFYIVVKEYEPFNCNNVYEVEVEWTGQNTFNSIFAIDYDEGQEIDIIKIYSEYEMESMLIEAAWKGEKND